MFYKFIYSIACLTVFISCTINPSEIKKELVKTDSTSVEPNKCVVLFNEAKRFDTILLKATVVNNTVEEQAIKAFYEFANNCASDTLAPVFLLKAGQVAQSINKYTQAQAFFTKCIDEFPKFKNRGAALFLQAQLYDNASMLNNETEAKAIYEQLIREYPKTAFADDARACIYQ